MRAIKTSRVVVIGLDGLEPGLVEPMMARGELPNLASLRDRGGFARVATTSPAQTPVAWSTFATGRNPGGHGIFDFLRRDPKTYLPDLALNTYEQKNAFTPPKAVNRRRGVPIWEILADAGVPSTVLRCPCTYPADRVRCRLLAGMGVPDLRGGLGTSTFYTTSDTRAAEGEQVVRVERDGSGLIRTHLIGPRGPRDPEGARLEIVVRGGGAGEPAVIECAAGNPERLEVRPGAWSDWLRVRFKTGLFQTAQGMVRFRLVGQGDGFGLYASPVNFDPAAPLFPISEPAGYAAELAEDLGPFYTTGMVEDHAGLSNGRLDEAAFLEQCDEVWDEREAMMLRELERGEDGFFYCLFDTPDRVQHLFWRFREADHPANRGRRVAPEFARTIEDHYRRADAAVGAALELTDERTLVIALSDHGFGSFRRCVDLNAWLHDQGLLHLADGRRPGHEAGEMLRHIDWSRTSAYAVGLGGIYLNTMGRESKGIVRPDEAEALKRRIAGELSGLVDPATGEVAVREARTREDVYRGPCVSEAPDLVVHTSRGYRVSWATSMGGVGSEVFSDNREPWAGDHIVDPVLVPGMLLMNRGFRGAGASLVDLAPTILGALGVAPGPEMEGSSLLS